MVSPVYCLVLILYSSGCPALPGITLRLRLHHQAHLETSLLEVHPPCDMLPNLSGPADTQHLRKKHLGKYEGSLRVLYSIENTLPIHGQYFHKTVAYFSRGSGIPYGSLAQACHTMNHMVCHNG